MQTGNKKCLSEFQLGAYLEGKLPPDEKGSMEMHIMECRQCREELLAVRLVTDAKDDRAFDDVPEHLINKAVGLFPEKKSVFDVVLNMVRDYLDVDYCSNAVNIFSPLPAEGLRSNKTVRPEMIVLNKSFEDIDVELDVEKISESICNIRVTVKNLKAEFLKDTIRVELVSGDRELVSNLLENGETILEDVTVGKYAIKICHKSRTLGEIVLKIQ